MNKTRALELLELTKVIQHYEGEIDRQTGGQFNLMQILGVGHLEVKTHSPILGELLSPSGTHGQGAIFLECFIKQLGLPDFDPKSANLRLEYHAGTKTEDSGGRIDLFLQDRSGGKIIIENKIYAQEQEQQMLRYGNAYPEAHLIYLTLNGDEPKTTGDNPPKRLRSIAYKTEILDWLVRCRKEAANVPIVREAISQYINLIRQLTQQNTNHHMNQRITEATLNDATSLRAYFALVQTEAEVKEQIVANCLEKIRRISRELTLDFHGPDRSLGAKYAGFEFSRKDWELHGFSVRFEMEYGGFNGFAFGFCDGGRMRDGERSRLRSTFEEIFDRSNQTDSWPAWLFWDPYRNWTPEVFESIQFGGFIEDLKHLLEKLIDCSETFVKGEGSRKESPMSSGVRQSDF